MRCSCMTENNNHQSDKKEILTNNQGMIYKMKNLKENNIYLRMHVLRVKCLCKSWVMNKTLQIFAVFAMKARQE